jgi:putative oxidoreductase
MHPNIQGIVAVLGRVLLSASFLLSPVGNKIPNFAAVAQMMGSVGVPIPEVMLAGAIAFLIAGSLSVILGLHARIGASLLIVFLVLATYYFHPFWRLEGAEQLQQNIQFMKNLALAGAMLFIVANGSGAWSLDRVLFRKPLAASPQLV